MTRTPPSGGVGLGPTSTNPVSRNERLTQAYPTAQQGVREAVALIVDPLGFKYLRVEAEWVRRHQDEAYRKADEILALLTQTAATEAEPCGACNGSGAERVLGRDNSEEVIACSICGGTGAAALTPPPAKPEPSDGLVAEMYAALKGLDEAILPRAESNASGNLEWEAVSGRINAARAAIARAETHVPRVDLLPALRGLLHCIDEPADTDSAVQLERELRRIETARAALQAEATQ